MDSSHLTAALRRKIEQQIELTDGLIGLFTPEHLTWQPVAGTFRLDELLGHLLETCAGFCAALYAFKPAELAHFEQLRGLAVNHRCGISEARERLQVYRAHIVQGFARLDDTDLGRFVPTIFAAEGETALTILLSNLEHLINHKYQLFFYAKLLGIEVGTPDLYAIQPPS
jgi:hypothetical protein